mmetsp:Transcript_70747/g.199785  ORF Transcript_70747/g.199785 Transcript_70747/m.199785 type:complete len:212 (+) Transcript_70747:314-949(+)
MRLAHIGPASAPMSVRFAPRFEPMMRALNATSRSTGPTWKSGCMSTSVKSTVIGWLFRSWHDRSEAKPTPKAAGRMPCLAQDASTRASHATTPAWRSASTMTKRDSAKGRTSHGIRRIVLHTLPVTPSVLTLSMKTSMASAQIVAKRTETHKGTLWTMSHAAKARRAARRPPAYLARTHCSLSALSAGLGESSRPATATFDDCCRVSRNCR